MPLGGGCVNAPRDDVAASRPRYPEHEKLADVSEQSQAIGEFLDMGLWTLCRFDERRSEFAPVQIEAALAEYFGIDQVAIDREKAEMLEEIRRG